MRFSLHFIVFCHSQRAALSLNHHDYSVKPKPFTVLLYEFAIDEREFYIWERLLEIREI